MLNTKRITNPKAVKAIREFYTAKISVWIDEENDYKHYIYRDKLDTDTKKKSPTQSVLNYQGSSKDGKGKPKENLMEDMRNTTKEILYEILDTSGEGGSKLTNSITGWLEQKHIVEHLLEHGSPVDGRIIPTAKNLYNEHCAGVGTTTYVKMVSAIKTERFWEKYKRYLAGEDVGWKRSTISKTRIKYLLDNLKFIQSREKREGLRAAILQFAEQARLYPHVAWKGELIGYMPEEGSDNDEEIGDGNQSARMLFEPGVLYEELDLLEIPFEDHDGIILRDKENLGNRFNPRLKDKGFEWQDEDFKRDVHNIVHEYKLADGDGEVDKNHPKIQDILQGLDVSSRVYTPLLKEVFKYFKVKAIKDQAEIDGSYDFSSTGIGTSKDANRNAEQLEIVKRCHAKAWTEKTGYEFDDSNIVVMSAGMFFEEIGVSSGSSIFKKLMTIKDDTQKFPEALGFLLYFKLERYIDTYIKCDRLHKGVNDKTAQMDNLLQTFEKLGVHLIIEPAEMTDKSIQALPYYEEVVQEIKDENEKNKFVPDKIDGNSLTFDDKNDTIKELKFDIKKHNYRKALAA